MRLPAILLCLLPACVFDSGGTPDDEDRVDPAAILDGVGHLRDAAADEDASAQLDAADAPAEPTDAAPAFATDSSAPAPEDGAVDAQADAADPPPAVDAAVADAAPTPKATCEPCEDTLECEEGLRCRDLVVGFSSRVCLPEIPESGSCGDVCEHLPMPNENDGVCRPVTAEAFNCRC